ATKSAKTTATTKPNNNAKSTKKPKTVTQTVTVTVDGQTTFTQTVNATEKDLAVGSCVSASGTVDSVGTVTAKNVTMSQPENGSCTAAGGFGGGGFGGGGFGGRFFGPGGAGGNGGAAPQGNAT